MKVTFVQNDEEKLESDKVIKAGLSLKKAKVGTWVLPPGLSANDSFVVVDSPTGKDVYVGSFKTLDGALIYALGIHDADTKADYDYPGALKDRGNFV